jgi:hypothetical protein
MKKISKAISVSRIPFVYLFMYFVKLWMYGSMLLNFILCLLSNSSFQLVCVFMKVMALLGDIG